ncbi:hypothetical protein EMIHUDRAFT_459619 [Emiliania huxleyi CCMP1516]|uniref:J domain-containing protein n=2 Tax=Emiliania huxleyi TaxID=2903 RepID=A0A0D3IP04_EMIH1|nr:hypothetical protein EMIHUDRAFT_459619 [Emiliania huxleyi CCMP1516]EOD12989.1 hypothetical protein EMIHUDRAFT_459619 [Emiliania huxleyi CCMP1516]|mmetsp:Transcript_13509/g.44697  ORF Transcript_13509/g.44697 Transcript_13509/m.44697 type:complete len:170 (+) Transcript_13509:59-568(+)|eukprot:XP_005765418.1 hypothetical protein EMIHUDRAFT_459619 [Emiliania huxleyi CCMP1516]
MATAYELLGVPRDASSDELRRAYHRLAREQHPDRAAGSLSRAASVDFVALQEAWEAVRDPEARRLYDASLRADEAAAARVRARAAPVDLGEMDYAEGSDGQGVWSYACRCGAAFELTEQMLCAGIEARCRCPAPRSSRAAHCPLAGRADARVLVLLARYTAAVCESGGG